MLYECFVDGASRGQGTKDEDGNLLDGHGAAAVLIYKNKKLIGQYARALGRTHNNQAEYEAVILALIMCWSAGLEDPIIYSDSNLVVNQINGEWDCKNEDLIPLLLSIKEIQEVYRFRVKHVPRSFVAEADELANKILNEMLQVRQVDKKKTSKKRKKSTREVKKS
jgi:ribonuclease HI